MKTYIPVTPLKAGLIIACEGTEGGGAILTLADKSTVEVGRAFVTAYAPQPGGYYLLTDPAPRYLGAADFEASWKPEKGKADKAPESGVVARGRTAPVDDAPAGEPPADEDATVEEPAPEGEPEPEQ